MECCDTERILEHLHGPPARIHCPGCQIEVYCSHQCLERNAATHALECGTPEHRQSRINQCQGFLYMFFEIFTQEARNALREGRKHSYTEALIDLNKQPKYDTSILEDRVWSQKRRVLQVCEVLLHIKKHFDPTKFTLFVWDCNILFKHFQFLERHCPGIMTMIAQFQREGYLRPDRQGVVFVGSGVTLDIDKFIL